MCGSLASLRCHYFIMLWSITNNLDHTFTFTMFPRHTVTEFTQISKSNPELYSILSQMVKLHHEMEAYDLKHSELPSSLAKTDIYEDWCDCSDSMSNILAEHSSFPSDHPFLDDDVEVTLVKLSSHVPTARCFACGHSEANCECTEEIDDSDDDPDYVESQESPAKRSRTSWKHDTVEDIDDEEVTPPAKLYNLSTVLNGKKAPSKLPVQRKFVPSPFFEMKRAHAVYVKEINKK